MRSLSARSWSAISACALTRELSVPNCMFNASTVAALLLTGRGLVLAAVRLGRSLQAGELTLAAPTEFEHVQALAIVERYAGFGLDLPDAVSISMAVARHLPLLTWDFRHARVVMLSGSPVELMVAEHELPAP